MRRAATAGAAVAVVIVLAAVAVGGGGSWRLPTGPAAAAPSSFVADPERSVEVAPAYVPAAGVSEIGPLGNGTPLTVDVGLASRDPSGLDAYVNATEVPGTPMFRAFLSPAAADQRFGALAGSVAVAEGYFASYGLTTAVHPDGLILSVSGPAPDVGKAFGTTFEQYRSAAGSRFVTHSSPARLPDIAPWTGALGLDTQAAFVPQAVAAPGSASARPASTCVELDGYLAPCDLANAYDLAGLYANGTNGTGERVAVIDAYTPLENASELTADFRAFSSAGGLPTGSLSFAYPVPFPSNENLTDIDSAWGLEDALDVEWSHAAAPGASVTMVFSPNPSAGLYFAIDWVVAGREANVISMSWGEPEVGIFDAPTMPCSSGCNASTDGSFDVLNPVLELGAAEGIGAFAASGDCGSADGTSGVSTNYPASDPYVTGVGATNLTLNATGGYGSESAWGGNGSGAVGAGCYNQGGSGGGFSILPRPAWQAGSGTVASRGRGVPDVAMVGGALSPAFVEYNSVGEGAYGTSLGTPIWAGIEAVADQAYGGDLGSLNPSLYRILRSSSYASDFHPITSGSNGYPAHAGWNPVTGVGTPIVGNLVGGLARPPAALSNLSTYVYASPRFGISPLTVRFAVTASGGTGTYPLEGVAFGDGNASTAVGGTVAHTYLTEGLYSAQAYVVDSAGNISVSPPVVVDVGGHPLSVGLSANTTAPAVGGSVTFTATVAGGTGPFFYNFSFGDGSFVVNSTAASVVHRYAVGGAFCAEVVARTGGVPPDGAASPRLAVGVGGAATTSCGNPSEALTLTANGTPAPRDAPADFPSLFVATGGSTAPDGLPAQVSYVSNDPYTFACECTVFPTAGTYEVRAWENDTVDGEANATTNVTVEPALKATFGSSALAGHVPLVVQFDATVSGGYLASAADTHWRFGNGHGAVGTTVSATYTTAGEYVAIASLSDSGFGNASEAFVVDAEPATVTPVGVTGTVSPAVNVSSGTTVLWSAAEVGPASALAGSVLAWDLGNGGDAFGPTASETYLVGAAPPPADVLDAGLTVESATLVPLAQVALDLPSFFATEAGGFVPASDALLLSGTLPPTIGVVPLAVAMTASASGPGGTTLKWAFGDGGTASGGSGSHVFYASGRYTVEVTATDPYADSADLLQTVVANPPLGLAGCGPSSRSGSAPFTVVLDPNATGGNGPPYRYDWTLPNGSTTNATSVALTFGSPGTYRIGLVVYDPSDASFGCAWTVDVTSVPIDAFFAVVLGGAATGIVLAVVFVWSTRPRTAGDRQDPGGY